MAWTRFDSIRNYIFAGETDRTPAVYTNSFGAELSKLRGRRRFHLAGTAKAIWESELSQRILEAVHEHATRINGSRQEQESISIECWMWGVRQDRAHPTVFVLSSPKTGQRILKLLNKLGILSRRGFKGITMTASKISYVSNAEKDIDPQFAFVRITDKNEIPGSELFVPGLRDTYATMTLTVCINGGAVFLGPRHAFTVHRRYSETAKRERKHTKPLYRVDPFIQSSKQQGRDWILLQSNEIDSDFAKKASEVLTIQEKTQTRQVRLGEVEEKPPSEEVSIISRRGVLGGIGTGTTSLVKIEGSGFCRVWAAQLNSPLEVGDSGSLVIDPTSGKIYGMLIATSGELQVGYIVPMVDILQDIRTRLPTASIELAGRSYAEDAFCSKETLVDVYASTLQLSSISSRQGYWSPKTADPVAAPIPSPLQPPIPPPPLPSTPTPKQHPHPPSCPTTTTTPPPTTPPPTDAPAPVPPPLWGSVPHRPSTRCLYRTRGARATPRESQVLKADDGVEDGEDPWSPLILSLDGGGIRGYSSLLILQRLMSEVTDMETAMQKEEQTRKDGLSLYGLPGAGKSNLARHYHTSMPDNVLPCHYFDYIYGTSTGGLIAILLSRLRMTVSDALYEYEKLTDQIFNHPRVFSQLGPLWWPGRSKFSTNKLDASIKDIMRRRGVSTSPFATNPNLCKTWVNAAYERDKQRKKFLLCTERSSGLLISQAARATSAAPYYFKALPVEGGFLSAGERFSVASHEDEKYVMKSFSAQATRCQHYRCQHCTDCPERRTTDVSRSSLRRHFTPHKPFRSRNDWKRHIIETNHRGTDINDEISHLLTDFGERYQEPKDDQLFPSSKKLLALRAEAFDFLERPETQLSLRSIATRLVKKRRQRSRTDRWESFAFGAKWKCLSCSREEFETRTNLKDHMAKKHNFQSTAEDQGSIDKLLDNGVTK